MKIDLEATDDLLVVSDELTGRGHPRGELIRLSLQAETDPSAEAERDAWLARHREALEPIHSNELKTIWRRGFIQEIQAAPIETQSETVFRRTRTQLRALLKHPSCDYLHTMTVAMNATQQEHLDALAELIPPTLSRVRCVDQVEYASGGEEHHTQPWLPTAYNVVMLVNHFPSAGSAFPYRGFSAKLRGPREWVLKSENAVLDGIDLHGIEVFRLLEPMSYAAVAALSAEHDFKTLEVVSDPYLELAAFFQQTSTIDDLTVHCLTARQLKVLLTTFGKRAPRLNRLSLPCAMLTDRSARAFIDARDSFSRLALSLPRGWTSAETQRALQGAIPSLTFLPPHPWLDRCQAPDDEGVF